MSNFYENLNKSVDNVSVTENGAVGYKTTNHAMLDFNFKISSYRKNLEKAKADFKAILAEDEAYALKFLFYVRDAREGVGERDLFRTCLKVLVESTKPNVDEVIDTIIKETPKFGRWDDLFVLLDTKYNGKVFSAVKSQLAEDYKNYQAKKSISLLAKWMPSENAASKETKKLARLFISALGTTPKTYRQTLSTLREYLKVVETMTCAKEWDEIDYNAVPSKANLKYKNAFLRNDETRRREYLNKLQAGDKSVKINSSVNFPHDIVHKYTTGSWGLSVTAYDQTLEELWKNLKGCEGLKDTVVVRDDSGSMTSKIPGTDISCLEVATALGIYCAEHCSESYKNKIITFSMSPRYLNFSDPKNFGSLQSKLSYLYQHSEVCNTNVQAVFDLILKTAVDNNLSAEDMPKQILILSDMEFDDCASVTTTSSWQCKALTPTLFGTIDAKYRQYGYKLPRLIFWNLCSRTGTIPMKQNDLGVVLVSGFSQNILKLVQSGKTDPYEVLVDGLNVERYSRIPLLTYGKTDVQPVVKKSTKKSRKVDTTPDFLR